MDLLKETIKLMNHGILDSFCGMLIIKDYPIFQLQRTFQNKDLSAKKLPLTEIKTKLLQNTIISAISCGSVEFMFYYVFLPLVRSVFLFVAPGDIVDSAWYWFCGILIAIMKVFWVIPIALVSRFITTFLLSDIAEAAFKITRGSPVKPSVDYYANWLCSLIHEVIFMVQSIVAELIPFVGTYVGFIHWCFMVSVFAFDYKWCYRNWPLSRRMTFVSLFWPYFLGFGLPLTTIATFVQWYTGGISLFGVMYPFYVLSAINVELTLEKRKHYQTLPIFFISTYLTNILCGKLVRHA